MELDIRIGNRLTKVKLLGKNQHQIRISVDEKIYDLDICKVEANEYSLLHNGQSHNIEVIEGENFKQYIANTYFKSFDIEIVDAETRYRESRNKGSVDQEQNIISTPMPGKVVRIPVNVNDRVVTGQTVIVVSAMKMESEYKVSRDALVKKILVNAGDIIKSHQPLILLE